MMSSRKTFRGPTRGFAAGNLSEVDLMAAIKRLAVKEGSKLGHRIKLGRTVQPPGTRGAR